MSFFEADLILLNFLKIFFFLSNNFDTCCAIIIKLCDKFKDLKMETGLQFKEILNALMRLTLYGLDPDTKQRVVLRVPSLFPVEPPQVSKG